MAMQPIRREAMSGIVTAMLDPSQAFQMNGAMQIINQVDSGITSIEEFRAALRTGWLGRIVSIQDRVVGILLYSAYHQGRKIELIAVDEEFRRQRVGATLVECMKRSLASVEWLKEICVIVPEDGLVLQQFFRSCGFRCYEILPGELSDSYLMAIRKVESECCEFIGAKAVELLC